MKKLNQELVLHAGMIERAGAAVQWCLKTLRDDWGPVIEGAEAWATLRVRDSIEVTIGRVSAGILEALIKAADGIPDGMRVRLIQHASQAEADAYAAVDPMRQAWGWPWGHDDGAELCRASMFVLEEAAHIARGWDRLGEVRAALAEKDGPEAWEENGGLPSRAVAILAQAAAWAWYRKERVPAFPLGVSHALSMATSRVAVWTDTEAELLFDGERASGRFSIPAITGPIEWAGEHEAAELAGILAPFLAFQAHAQWQAGVTHADNVFLPASRDALAKTLGRSKVKEEELEEALQWLTNVRVYGWGLVEGFDRVDRHPEQRVGRSTPFYRVRVGEALCPWHGIEACVSRGYSIPDRMRFLAPVLPMENAPLVGDHRTRDRQRTAFSLSTTAAMVTRREQYLDWGGIEPSALLEEWRRLGCYVRTHSDLTERMLEAYLQPPEQLTLEGRTGPVLIQFERNGKKLLRLGPDYHAAERMIIGAGNRTKTAREGGKAAARMRRERK